MCKIVAKWLLCHLSMVQQQMCYEICPISLEQFHCHRDRQFSQTSLSLGVRHFAVGVYETD